MRRKRVWKKHVQRKLCEDWCQSINLVLFCALVLELNLCGGWGICGRFHCVEPLARGIFERTMIMYHMKVCVGEWGILLCSDVWSF